MQIADNDIPPSTAAWELARIVKPATIAKLVGAPVGTVNQWRYGWAVTPREPKRGRLLLAHELAYLIAIADQSIDVEAWFFAADAGGPSPAALIGHNSADTVREHLVLAARETLGAIEPEEREALARMRQRIKVAERGKQSKEDAAATKVARALRAASQMLEVLRPAIVAGQLGVVRDGRVILVPSETIDQIRTMAPTSLAATEPQLISLGLATLGAATYGGKNTVPRRVGGLLKRVWDLPQNIVFSEN